MNRGGHGGRGDTQEGTTKDAKGAKDGKRSRLQRAIARAGGVRERFCPSCGDVMTLSDERRTVLRGFRYQLACAQECVVIMRGTVAQVIDEWNELCAQMARREERL